MAKTNTLNSDTWANRPNPLSLFGMVIIILVGLGYGAITLSVNDPLWFIPWFEETPTYVAVYCYGEKTELDIESPEAVEIYTTLNELLFGSKRWDPTSMSDETLNYYQTNHTMVVIELHYHWPAAIANCSRFLAAMKTKWCPVRSCCRVPSR